jgi:hypothetical protein
MAIAVATGVGCGTRWWEWPRITSVDQLTWLPCDYELCDMGGNHPVCCSGVASPPRAWDGCDPIRANNMLRGCQLVVGG